jgi:proline iminopeptidase
MTGAATVDGAFLRYVCEGVGRPTIVIGSVIYYPRTFSYRLRTRLRMVFVDVRHFADGNASFSTDEISLDTYLHDLEAVQAHLGLDRVILVGHSHHGNLAIEYAKRFPSRVSHVVLIGSPPLDVESTVEAAAMYWDAHASERRKATLREKQSAVLALESERITPEQAYVSRYVAEGPKYWHDPTYDASRLWQGVPLDVDVITVFRNFFADGYQLQWDPERMTAPVLVIMGRHDYAVPPTLWDNVRPKLTNLTFHRFEHSGHTPQLEEPERFDQVLLDWLETA